MATVFLTGCAGFIGFNYARYILKNTSYNIIAIDSLRIDESIKLKRIRLNILRKSNKFSFRKIDITNKKKLFNFVYGKKITYIVHLAAIAGVRESIKYPDLYFENNINGFFNILELSKKNRIKHLLYASSSSVYGDNKSFPSKENINTDKPLSFYSATKKTNEIIAYSFSKMYKIPTTGLRFFSVYGPYGRLDMAILKFINQIHNNKKISLYNSGNHFRDFTFIDDAVMLIDQILKSPPKTLTPYNIFNISSGKSTSVLSLIKILKNIMKNEVTIKKDILQIGDVIKTHGDSSKIKKIIKTYSKTSLRKGLEITVDWYRMFKDKI